MFMPHYYLVGHIMHIDVYILSIYFKDAVNIHLIYLML